MRPGEFKRMLPTEPKVRTRKCAVKSCRKPFPPRSMSHKACSPECAAEYAKLEREKKDRQERQKGLQELKTKRDYIKEAQRAWNSYVRARDAGKPCCSCGAMPGQVFGGSMDCSHYRSIGAAPHLRFHLHNAAAACVKCNRWLGGNVVSLRAGLVERIGEEKILAIEANNSIRKFSDEYLIRLKNIFTKKTRRELKNADKRKTC